MTDDLFSSLGEESAAPAPAKSAAPKSATASSGKPAAKKSAAGEDYSAADIEILEGLEPVRRRPGMYIGGTDEKALHHLFAEVLDNSMDEAVAGHASFIEVELDADGYIAVTDNGRGIPVDPHPKHPDRSALEIILTTLHAGGKFDSKAYNTSGGLHGVGISVVNALSDDLVVERWRATAVCFASAIPEGSRWGRWKRSAPLPTAAARRCAFTPTRKSSVKRRASTRPPSIACAGPRPTSSAA